MEYPIAGDVYIIFHRLVLKENRESNLTLPSFDSQKLMSSENNETKS